MPADIRIYFEGDRLLKPGFDSFFAVLRERAREKRCRFELVSARSGEEARRDFETALKTNRGAWSILLIDSEGPLRRKATGRHAGRTFWMVEMMEAWFHADKDALARYYGQGFQRHALKANPNVEKIAKADLETGLKTATKRCKKGAYHKTSHGPKLLGAINPLLVRQAAPNCERLFQAILNHLH
jgi:Domain of unknown function (DUF4276)